MATDRIETAELERIVAAATPGPWYVAPNGVYVTDKRVWMDDSGARHGDTPNMVIDCATPENAALIAMAPNLAAEVLAFRSALVPAPAVPDAEPFPAISRDRLREKIMADPDPELDCDVRPSASDPWPPCPFCGSANLFKRTTVSPVSCGHCGAEGPAAHFRGRWEKRAAPAVPDDVAQAAERVAQYLSRRKKSRSDEPENIHGYDVSPEGGFPLRASDLETLIRAALSHPDKEPTQPAPDAVGEAAKVLLSQPKKADSPFAEAFFIACAYLEDDPCGIETTNEIIETFLKTLAGEKD